MTKNLYPLTASQNMLHRAAREFGTAQVLTIGVCVTTHAALDFDLLRTCMEEETSRHACLRLHFTAPDKDGRILQYIAPPFPLPAFYLDMRSMEEEIIREQMTAWSAKGFEGWDIPLFRFAMVSLPGGWDGLYLCIDHRIIDSCGLVSMMKDLLELYCHRRYKTPAPSLPVPYEEILKQELTAQKTAGRQEKDLAFWKQLLAAGEPIYADISGTGKLKESRRLLNIPDLRASLRTVKPMDGDMAHFTLSAQESKVLLAFCKEQSVSMTNLVLMGMRTCLSYANEGQEDISIKNYVARRTSRRLRTCGGCRIHCYPCRTVIPLKTSFLDGVRQIQDHQNQIYRHCDLDPVAVDRLMAETFGMPETTTYEGTALTCQPSSFLPDHPLLKRLPVRAEWFSSKADIQKLYLTVMPEVGRECLGFYFKYQTAELEKEDVTRFYDNLRTVLSAGVEHPGVNVGNIYNDL